MKSIVQTTHFFTLKKERNWGYKKIDQGSWEETLEHIWKP